MSRSAEISSGADNDATGCKLLDTETIAGRVQAGGRPHRRAALRTGRIQAKTRPTIPSLVKKAAWSRKNGLLASLTASQFRSARREAALQQRLVSRIAVQPAIAQRRPAMRIFPWTIMLAATQAYELCVGQDYWSIMNYTAVMGKPACVMSYASLYNLTAALWNGTSTVPASSMLPDS